MVHFECGAFCTTDIMHYRHYALNTLCTTYIMQDELETSYKDTIKILKYKLYTQNRKLFLILSEKPHTCSNFPILNVGT